MPEISQPRARRNTLGLVLFGGGARGAYHSGVLKALYEIAAASGLRQPFPIVTGVSAGAINACFLASAIDERIGTSALNMAA